MPTKYGKRTSFDLPLDIEADLDDALILRPEIKSRKAAIVVGLRLLIEPMRPLIAEMRALRAKAKEIP
jgi:hypothetical protein